MKKLIVTLLFSVFLIACAARAEEPRSYYYPGRLNLFVSQSGRWVRFTAYVRMPSNHLQYKCLRQFWVFGDGRAEYSAPDCDRFGNPYGRSSFRYVYRENHFYFRPGRYIAYVELRDQRGRRIARSNRVFIFINRRR